MATDKDTIYVDIDDEITGIIDKVKASEGKVVALVLPKRAGVFQSIVNMKLLKRAADESKKNLALITTEASLLPLAGAAGIHVAKTLTSKPEIPAGPASFDDAEETVDEDGAETVEQPLDSSKPVGELAGGAAAATEGMETIALDDEDLPPEEAAAVPAAAKTFKPPKKKKDKKLKIPNFDRFRLFLALGILLLILLIGGFIFANASLAKATINIKTDATNVSTNQDLTLSTSAQSLNPSSGTIPTKLEQQQKTYTQQVPTTGQKNNGNKASGSVTVINCGDDTSIPEGTGLKSSGGNTYITQNSLDVPASNYDNHSHCKSDVKVTVPVIAQSAGSAFNLPAGTSFTVTYCSPVDCSQVSASGGTIDGGTDNIVQSVNQNDINNAKSKISAANDSTMKQALDSQTKGDGYYPIDATFNAGTPNITSSAQVGDITSTVTVTETINYMVFGVHQADLTSLIDGNIKTQIDTSKQSILDDGLSNAVFNVNNQTSTGASITMSTKAVVGPQLNIDAIKSSEAGKKAGAIKSDLSNNPDVTSVDVKFSPFWVSTTPKKTSRITVNIAKPTAAAKSNSNGSNP
jgi:hypothetical protein